MTLLTDRRSTEDALPDVPPGEDYECVITPQTHGALHKVLTRGHKLHLVRLQIGVTEVPFELHGADGGERRFYYRPTAQQHAADCESANAAAYCACTRAAVPLLAGQDVRLTLRNDGTAPTKPRAVLLVQEEDLP